MTRPRDRLIHCLLSSLELETTLFHLGQYCGQWKASTTGLARAGFHLVLHGECWLHRPDSGQREALQAGDAVIFLRDVAHFLSPLADPEAAACAPRKPMQALDRSQAGSVGLACGFFDFRSHLGQTLLAVFPEQIVLRRDDPELHAIRPVADLILAEAENGGDESSPVIRRLVDLLLFNVIRHLVANGSVDAGLWALLAEPSFAPLLEAVLAEPGHDWNVEAMANLSHMSRATFHKRFAQACGVSPSHFLLQVRMQTATQLIEAGQSLARTAEQVGYQSEAAFSRAFKKATGILPGAYRRTRRLAA